VILFWRDSQLTFVCLGIGFGTSPKIGEINHLNALVGFP
jgi:hypothetical protein